MALLFLNINKPLCWTLQSAPSDNITWNPAQALAFISTCAEGSELLFYIETEKVIKNTDDGPFINQANVQFNVIQAINTGQYTFSQVRIPELNDANAWFVDKLECFVRDAWWEKIEFKPHIVIRLVKEDQKTALQFIM